MAVCASFVIVDVLQLGHRWNGLLNFKPFTCKTCMSGWLVIPLCFDHSQWFYIPYIMAIAMTASYIINRFIDKL